MKLKIASRFLSITGLRSVLSRVARWSGVLCLNYHRIGSANRSVFDWGLWSATAQAFDSQITWLKSRFDVIGADDLPAALADRKGRYVMITFDDGYRDNYSEAFPILKRNGVSATFFVATGFVDNPRLPWWDEIAWMVRTCQRPAIELPSFLASPLVFAEPDREQAVRALLAAFKSMPAESTTAYLDTLGEAAGTGRFANGEGESHWMTWAMLREMRTAGMSVGGHTVNHPILANMSLEQQSHEISECGRRIADEMKEPMRYFSYPVGNPKAFNDDTRKCLQDAGVEFAFSYYGGYRKFDEWDNYDIRRLMIENNATLDIFRTSVSLPKWFGRVSV